MTQLQLRHRLILDLELEPEVAILKKHEHILFGDTDRNTWCRLARINCFRYKDECGLVWLHFSKKPDESEQPENNDEF